MKFVFLITFNIILIFHASAQELKISDLTQAMNMDVGEINNLLIERGWKFEMEEKKDSVSQLDWSLKQEISSENKMPQAWIFIIPNSSATYTFHATNTYKLLYHEIISLKVQKIGSELYSGEIVAAYKGRQFSYFLYTDSQKEDYPFTLIIKKNLTVLAGRSKN
jgi:hypothetical protein